MTSIDYILLTLAVIVAVHQLILLYRMKKNVVIPGVSPNRAVVAVMLIAILILAIWRTPNIAQSWPVFAVIALACITIFAGGCGLGKDGMYSNGRFVPFRTAVYYEFEKRTDGTVIFHLSRLTREGIMRIDPSREEAIVSMMEEHSIPTYEAYQKRSAQRVRTRTEAQMNKKKKKK